MQFKILRTKLLNSLSKVTKAVSNKSPLPALTGIKFDLLNNQLILTGSDSDITIQTIIEEEKDILEIINEGSIVLSARFISEIIRKIDSKFVTFDLVDGCLTKITGDNSEFNLNGVKSIDYPKIDLSKTGENFKIDSFTLKNTIEKTIFAASDREARPTLTGLNLKSENGFIHCTCTDSYRLANVILELEDTLDFNITIPSKSLSEVSKIIERDELIDVYITDRKILFVFDNVFIQTRLIDGTYPDTSRLIPSEFEFELNVDSRDLLSSLDRASLLTNESANVVKLSLSENEVTLHSSSQEIGSVEEHITSSIYSGSPLVISFSADYLSDAIKAIGSNKITLLFNGTMKPFVIKDKANDLIIQLVLPVRTY